jgi:uncharacterized membrane protein YfcA
MTFSSSGGAERAYERYGCMILSVSAILGISAAVLTTASLLSMFPSLHFQSTYPILRALGTTLVGFNTLALIMVLIPYRRYERWAWYTLGMLLPSGCCSSSACPTSPT